MLFISFDLLALAAMQSPSALISATHLASSKAARCTPRGASVTLPRAPRCANRRARLEARHEGEHVVVAGLDALVDGPGSVATHAAGLGLLRKGRCAALRAALCVATRAWGSPRAAPPPSSPCERAPQRQHAAQRWCAATRPLPAVLRPLSARQAAPADPSAHVLQRSESAPRRAMPRHAPSAGKSLRRPRLIRTASPAWAMQQRQQLPL